MAALGLKPSSHLGKELAELKCHLLQMNEYVSHCPAPTICVSVYPPLRRIHVKIVVSCPFIRSHPTYVIVELRY